MLDPIDCHGPPLVVSRLAVMPTEGRGPARRRNWNEQVPIGQKILEVFPGQIRSTHPGDVASKFSIPRAHAV